MSADPRAMAKPDPFWGRVAITEPGGRTVETPRAAGPSPTGKPTPSATAAMGAPSRRSYPFPSPRGPANLDEALWTACDGVAGITPAQFRALMSPEDINDIAAGAIRSKTLQAYAESFAEGIRSGRLVLAVRAKP
jgi:hypothetical protein